MNIVIEFRFIIVNIHVMNIIIQDIYIYIINDVMSNTTLYYYAIITN